MVAAKERDQVRPNQELIALSAANIGAALSSAYPVAGSFSRSGVNYASGARSPVSSIICAIIIVCTLLFFTEAFVDLPKAALAAGHESFDLVEFARAEIAGFGVRVDDRVGDDAHAVLPRNKRPPVGDRYPVNKG